MPHFSMRLPLYLLLRAAGLAYLLLTTLASHEGSDCSAVMRLDPPMVQGRPVNYESAQLILSNPAGIILDFVLGGGSFAETFLAHNTTSGEPLAIKLYRLPRQRQVMKGMIYREIHVLQSLCGHKNIIKLLHVVPHALTVDPALVFEYVENIEFQALLPTLSPEETQFYMHEIISAVAYAHAMGIVHMDIKPANIMIHNATRTLKVIDWGLSFYYVPDEEAYPGNVYYQSPETLLGYRKAAFSADMWAVGCILGSMLVNREPLFQSGPAPPMNLSVQVDAMAQIMGSAGMHVISNKYNLGAGFDLSGLQRHERVPWATLVAPSKRAHATADALDLLHKLLKYDYKERISAADALLHPYFHGVKDMRREG